LYSSEGQRSEYIHVQEGENIQRTLWRNTIIEKVNTYLIAGTHNSMADQREEEVPTVDICEPPERRLEPRDGRGTPAGDILADNKFGLGAMSILSVFAKFMV
jgi:hypothetical protein